MEIYKFIQKGVLILTTLVITMILISPVLANNKVDVDKLIYKFDVVDDKGTTMEGTKTTTDYIASLPEADDWQSFVANAVRLLLIVANILAFASFVISGIYMISSMGNEEQLSKAKRIFVYTVFAMVICATALALVTGITNIEFFNP